MKKVLFLLMTTIFIQLRVEAQRINNLVLFSNEGQKFILIMNGERRNENFETNVKVTGLNLATYKVRVIFENKDLNDVETTLKFFSTNKECVFGLMKQSRRKHTMDYVSETDINPVPEDNTSSAYNNTSNNNTSNNNTSSNNTYSNNTNTSTKTNTNTTPTTTYPNNSNTNSGNSVSLGNGNLGVGVNSNGGVSIKTREGNVVLGPHNETTAVINVLGNAVNLHKAAEKTGCASPMLQTQFEIAKKNVTSSPDTIGKRTATNQLIQSNCLLTSQVQELVVLFSDDQTKFELVRDAYKHTSDLNNYHKLKDSFKSDAYKKDFQTYISSQK